MRLLIAASALALAAACSPTAPAPSAAAPDPAVAQQITDLEGRVAAIEAEKAALLAPPADGAKAVYFVNISNGDEVTSPFRVIFGLSGMGIAPAGIEKENTGHHHLLIDKELTPEEMAFAIPNDDNHKHYGLGQTEAVLTLPPGQHTLQLALGDKLHELHKPPIMSEKITITVK